MYYLLVGIAGAFIGALVVSWNTGSMVKDILQMSINVTKQYETLVTEMLKAWRHTLTMLEGLGQEMEEQAEQIEMAVADLWEAIPQEIEDDGPIGMDDTPVVRGA